MIKMASITGDINQPSSRFRIRQHINELEKIGIYIDDFHSINGKYPPRGFINRLYWGARIIKERYSQLLKINAEKYDCVFLQREMISTLCTFEPFLKHPVILDVDDAIFLHKKGKFIEKISKKSTAIICGNSYLAKRFKQWNKNVYILPTAVDTEKFLPLDKKNRNNKRVTIGWVGTSSGYKYLYLIEKAIKKVLDDNPSVELLVVSNEKPDFNYIDKFNYVKWTAECEVSNFQKIDVGLMPLEEDEWTKGKCSYKMLQHMSCGVPVVVSSVGMNTEVLSKDEVGFGTTNYYSDWIDSLNILLNNQELCIKMGSNGRKVVQENYSLKVITDQLSNIIKKITEEEIK